MTEPTIYDPSVHHGYKEFKEVTETIKARYGTGGGECTNGKARGYGKETHTKGV